MVFLTTTRQLFQRRFLLLVATLVILAPSLLVASDTTTKEGFEDDLNAAMPEDITVEERPGPVVSIAE